MIHFKSQNLDCSTSLKIFNFLLCFHFQGLWGCFDILLLNVLLYGENMIMLILQESNQLLSRDNGYIRLKNLQKMLRRRQQNMITQVSLLYPVKFTMGPAHEQELESFPNTSRSGITSELLYDIDFSL